jgi:hypothetical protein
MLLIITGALWIIFTVITAIILKKKQYSAFLIIIIILASLFGIPPVFTIPVAVFLPDKSENPKTMEFCRILGGSSLLIIGIFGVVALMSSAGQSFVKEPISLILIGISALYAVFGIILTTVGLLKKQD